MAPDAFTLVRDLAGLKALAHPVRLEILRALRDEPRTAAEVGRALELAPQKAGYHIKQLEAAGLVRFTGAGVKRWKEERRFQAVARNFVVDPDLGADDPRARIALVAELERHDREASLRRTLAAGIAPLMDRVVGDYLGLRAGQRLLVLSGPHTQDLADALLVAAEARGVVPLQHSWGRSYVLARLDAHTAEELAGQDFLPAGLMEGVDAVCQLTCSIVQGAPPSPAQREKLPHLMAAVGRWQAELRERGVLDFELSVPSRQDFLPTVDPGAAMDTWWRIANQGADELRARRATLGALLDAGGVMRIRDDAGGMLELVLEPIERVPGAKGPILGLPAGGVSRLVRSDEAFGSLRAAYTLVAGRHHLEPRLTLAAGELVTLEGFDDQAQVQERIRAESGAVRSLAYVTLGASPVGGALTGKPSLDSVLAGVVTLAFGSNRALGGEQDATLDLRCTLARATVEWNGRVLVDAGRLVLGSGPGT